MIPTARILLRPAGPDDTMETAAGALLAQVGLTLTDVWLTSDAYATTTHFGNWVLVPVRDLPQLADLPPLPGYGARVDFRRTLIEASDIAALQEGQRATTTPRSAAGAKTKAASCAKANDKNTAT